MHVYNVAVRVLDFSLVSCVCTCKLSSGKANVTNWAWRGNGHATFTFRVSYRSSTTYFRILMTVLRFGTFFCWSVFIFKCNENLFWSNLGPMSFYVFFHVEFVDGSLHYYNILQVQRAACSYKDQYFHYTPVLILIY